jgi:hypothetical protein
MVVMDYLLLIGQLQQLQVLVVGMPEAEVAPLAVLAAMEVDQVIAGAQEL